MDVKPKTIEISPGQDQKAQITKLDPATLEALKTLSLVSTGNVAEQLTSCNKLTASLEQIRSKRNLNLFEKLDAIKQDFSGLNLKLAKMEESIIDLKRGTSNLVESLPSKDDTRQCYDLNSAR